MSKDNTSPKLETDQTTNEKGLDDAACYALLDPSTAPKDGTLILAAVGWPWLVPAMWCEYGQDWVIASRQVDYLHGSSVCHFENETEPEIFGWLPMPKIPKGAPMGGFLARDNGYSAEYEKMAAEIREAMADGGTLSDINTKRRVLNSLHNA